MRRLLFGIMVIVLAACKNVASDNVDCVQLHNPKLVGVFDVSKLGIVKNLVLYNDKIILNSSDSDNIFHVIDTKTGKLIYSFGRQGRGPGEYIRIGRQLSVSNSSLFFSDNASKRIFSVNLDSLSIDYKSMSWSYPYTIDFRPSKFLVINDKTICLGAIKDYRFGIIDNLSHELIAHDNHYMPHHEQIKGIYVGSVYQSIMQANPYKPLFVLSLLSSDFFEIFEIDGSDVKRIFSSEKCTFPIITKKSKIGTEYTIDYSKSLAGNVDVTTTADKILFLYSDKTYAEYAYNEEAGCIKCYDWSGNSLIDYKLPFPVSKIVASGDMLFCLKQDEETFKLYKFDL